MGSNPSINTSQCALHLPINNVVTYITMATKMFIIIMALVTALSAVAAGEVASSPGGVPLARGGGGSSGDIIRPRAQLTCDVYPRVCRAVGSPGPDCCGKDCFDVAHDALNCGQCGRKCAYGEACCAGSCVAVQSDPRNCGRCRNRCRKGGDCKYGMCDYA